MKNTPATKGTPTDRRLEALEKHRAGTQFQPLDADSPTVLVQVRLTEAQRDQVDVAAQAAGLSRSEAVRAALAAWLVAVAE